MSTEQMFEIFWTAYPKKKDKTKARKVFKKLNPDEALFKTILNALETQVKDKNWCKEGRQYMPYPSTYLNNRRWEDESDAEPCGADAENEAFGAYI